MHNLRGRVFFMSTTLVLSGIIGFLVLERLWMQWHHNRIVDRLTDKILARNYSDFEVGQALKHDQARDLSQEIVPRSDQVEHDLEQERIKSTRKHLGKLGEQITGAVEVPQ